MLDPERNLRSSVRLVWALTAASLLVCFVVYERASVDPESAARDWSPALAVSVGTAALCLLLLPLLYHRRRRTVESVHVVLESHYSFWRYRREEWIALRAWELGRARRRMMVALAWMVPLGAVVAATLAGRGHDASLAITAALIVVLGVTPLATLAWLFFLWLEYGVGPGDEREVHIARNGLYRQGRFIGWGANGRRLESVTLEQDGALQFLVLRVRRRIGTSRVHVMVPPGRQPEAEQLMQKLVP